MKHILFILLLSTSQAVFSANLDESVSDQISFLKSELLSSNCSFERNGKKYSASEAVKHINKKQAFFGNKIDSVERFIELTATKSTMSGRPYYIYCDDESKVESSIWLMNKTKEYGVSR